MTKQTKLIATTLAILLGTAIGYVLTAHPEVRDSISKRVGQTYRNTQSKANKVSEEVALKTAKLTGNPKINQDWVERQWGDIGY